MRSVDDVQLRAVLKDTYARMGKAQHEGRIASGEPLAFGGAVIPVDAQVFFPPISGRERSGDNAVIYIGDKAGSSIRVLPRSVRVYLRKSENFVGFRQPARSSSIRGAMAGFV